MAHDTTVHYDPDNGFPWAHWNVTCAEGDYTTDPVGSQAEALDSATWHAEQNGGIVSDPGSQQ